jgi:hypothetical protein
MMMPPTTPPRRIGGQDEPDDLRSIQWQVNALSEGHRQLIKLIEDLKDSVDALTDLLQRDTGGSPPILARVRALEKWQAAADLAEEKHQETIAQALRDRRAERWAMWVAIIGALVAGVWSLVGSLMEHHH